MSDRVGLLEDEEDRWLLKANEMSTIKLEDEPLEPNSPLKVDKDFVKKCKRCNAFYKETQNQNFECRHHPGTWTEFTLFKGTQWGWSCCRPSKEYTQSMRSLVKEASYQKNSKGCKIFDKHLEDEQYTRSVIDIPVVEGRISERQKQLEEMALKRNAKRVDKQHEKPTEPFFHVVGPNDTLSGLSLRYGVSAANIKRVNHLQNDQIYHVKKLLIPHTNDEAVIKNLILKETQEKINGAPVISNRLQTVKSFRQQTGADAEMAQFYLESANYDLDAALKEWKQDEEFEKKK